MDSKLPFPLKNHFRLNINIVFKIEFEFVFLRLQNKIRRLKK